MIKLLLFKTFLTCIVLLVPYVWYVGGKTVSEVPRWAQWLAVLLVVGAGLTFFAVILIAIWE